MKKKINLFQLASVALSVSMISSSLLAGGIATEQVGGSNITLSPSASYNMATLRVSGDDADVSKTYQETEVISMGLSGMSDGLYHYELSLISDAKNNTATASRQIGKIRISNGVASAYNNAVAKSEAAAKDAEKQATSAQFE